MALSRSLVGFVLLQVCLLAPQALAAGTSKFATMDRAGVVEAAVDELTGKNNGPRTMPGKTTSSIVVSLTQADEAYLVHEVFGPYLWDAEKRRILERAACQRYLRRFQIEWTKTIDEALSENACEVHIEARELFVNPAVKLALADQLLLGHPRRDALLNEVKLSISETVGATVHVVCYGERPGEPATLDDSNCHIDWSDPSPATPPRVAAFFFDAHPLEQWSLDDIVDAWTALTGMKSKAGQARIEKLRPAFQARVEKRNATIFANRQRAPAAVAANEAAAVLDKESVYLWHAGCGALNRKTVETDTGSSEVESICVKLAYVKPTKGWCLEDTYEFIKPPGASSFRKNGAASASDPIECP